MIIAKGVAVLEISGSVVGQPAMIYPTLVWDNEDVILIDTGWQMPLIVEAMEKVGVSLNKLTKVILTHQDLDHISGLPGILKSAEQKVEVMAHEVEKPYIEGEKPLVKATPDLKKELQKMLGEEKAAQVEAVFRNPPTSNVDRALADGEVLP
ncbi:MAG: MBL fold metallo-hydrolase, partial [Ignavibacteriales bacterium]